MGTPSGDDPIPTFGVFAHNHGRFVAESLQAIDTRRSAHGRVYDDGSTEGTREAIAGAVPDLLSRGYSVELDLDGPSVAFVRSLCVFLDTVTTPYLLPLIGDHRYNLGGIDLLKDAAERFPSADAIFGGRVRIDGDGPRPCLRLRPER